MKNWLIWLVLGGVGFLVLANPGKGFFGSGNVKPPSPGPTPNTKANATGSPGFTTTGAGNTIRTVGGIIGGVADIVGQITGRGVMPNIGSLLGPSQVTPPNLTDMNADSLVSSVTQLTDSSTSSSTLPFFDNNYAGSVTF